jgi:hypothetical protein
MLLVSWDDIECEHFSRELILQKEEGEGESMQAIPRHVERISRRRENTWLMARGLLAGVIALLVGVAAETEVVLNEVMYNPIGSELYDEFIEIFNTSTTDSIDLTGWKVGEPKELDNIVSGGQGLILQPRQYGLILDRGYLIDQNSHSYDPLPAKALLLTTNDSDIGGGLSNSPPDTVLFINAGGDTVAFYVYSGKGAEGHSDEKIDPLGGDIRSNWGISLSNRGTPGMANSLSADAVVIRAPIDSAVRGRETTIPITVRNIEDLYSVNFDLLFDPAVVRLVSVTDGGFLGSDGQSVSLQTAATDTSISVGVTRLGRVGGVSGEGSLATLVFSTLGRDSASTQLRLANVKLRDSRLGLLPVIVQDGRLTLFTVNVLRTSPAGNATNVITTAPVRVFFNRTPAGTVGDSTVMLTGKSRIPGGVSYQQDAVMVLFSATDTLMSSSVYTATLHRSVGLKGGDSTWVFTTSVTGDIFDIDDPLDSRMDDDYAGDGSVDGDDLAIIGYFYLSRVGETLWSPLPDLKRDGVIDINDLAILGRNYGRRSRGEAVKPLVDILQQGREALAGEPSVELIYNQGVLRAGTDFDVTVLGHNLDDLYALEFGVAFSEEGMEFDTIEKGSLMGRSQHVGLVRRIRDGRLYVGMTRLGRVEGAVGTGPLATIRFHVKRDITQPVLSLSSLSILHSDLSRDERVRIGERGRSSTVGEQPDAFFLSLNYPNPFNLGTSISYALPDGGWVYLAVYDTMGQRIRVLDDRYRGAGRYQVVWDGRDEQGNDLSSSVYFYRLSVNGSTWSRKMVLIR